MKRNEFMPPTTFHKGGDGRSRGFGYGGFSMGKNNKGSRNDEVMPPPPSATLSKHGYSTLTSITANALSATYGIPRVRAKTEEEYFDEDEESTSSSLAYQPAPGSPSAKRHDSDSEEDPLDAYMTALEKETRQERDDFRKPKDSKDKGIRDDIEDEDDEESYYRFIEENPNAAGNDDSDQEIDYDEDGNPIPPAKSKMYGFRVIDPLPPLDHSTIEYDKFEKNFYQEHSDIRTLGPADILQLRSTLGIKVSGPDPPKPVSSFAHFGFDEALMKAVRKSEYTQPTPIQAQGVPSALGGRDIIGIAKTGSGKTAAFLWPMFVHIMDQRELQDGEGPIGLILAPTRELSQQIYSEAKKFGKVYNIQVVCCYGGGSKWEQSKALEAGAEIVVGTPGRMIDLIKMKATNLQRVTMLVLDEADRMFDMGFEPQVRSICNHVRPDRQTLLFSATFKKRIERLARDILTDPIRIVQGDIGEANQDITQIVKVMPPGSAKWSWLLTHLVAFTSTGSVLIFVTKKVNSEELSANLRGKGYDNALLHGDMDQTERNKVITAFKRKEMAILVATDVAARGLDIPHIKTVINYDVARDIDTHTHRIGRTGRAGEKGTAYTLITERDKEFAGHLVRNLEGASQEVPGDLMGLAMQTSWFKKSRFKSGDGKRLNVGGRGLGYKERPGLGASKSSSSSYGDNDTSPSARMVGPGTDRLSTMKAAFKAQYTSQFTAAVDQTWQITRKPERPRKKSRWSAPEEDVPPTDQ